MAILVTGGTGYIGSHTVVELLNKNYDVVIVDNYVNSKPEVLSRIYKITGRTRRRLDEPVPGLLQSASGNKDFEEGTRGCHT